MSLKTLLMHGLQQWNQFFADASSAGAHLIVDLCAHARGSPSAAQALNNSAGTKIRYGELSRASICE